MSQNGTTNALPIDLADARTILRLVRERDAARAEAERLRAANERAEQEIIGMIRAVFYDHPAQFKALTDEFSTAELVVEATAQIARLRAVAASTPDANRLAIDAIITNFDFDYDDSAGIRRHTLTLLTLLTADPITRNPVGCGCRLIIPGVQP